MTQVSEPTLKVRLLITSDSLPPDEISGHVGVCSTLGWLKGQRVHPKASKTYDQNGWVIVAQDGGAAASAEKLTDEILHTVDISKILKFKSNHPDVAFELSIIVHVAASAPAVSLSAAQVKVLASLDADVDVDIYPG